GIAARLANAMGDFLAGIGLAAGDHNFRAEPCQKLGRRTADAAAGAGDDRDPAGEIEGRIFHGYLSSIVIPGRELARGPGIPDSLARDSGFVLRTPWNDDHCQTTPAHRPR